MKKRGTLYLDAMSLFYCHSDLALVMDSTYCQGPCFCHLSPFPIIYRFSFYSPFFSINYRLWHYPSLVSFPGFWYYSSVLAPFFVFSIIPRF